MRPPTVVRKLHPTALPAAALLHGLALGGLVIVAVPRSLPVPRPRAILAEFVTATQYKALLPVAEPAAPTPSVPQASLAAGDLPTPAADPEADPDFVVRADGLTAARHFHSGSILDRPENEALRQGIGQMLESEQMVQLCAIEAIEQLRLAQAATAPDAVVGYAFGALETDGLSLIAEGGAFRSEGEWYHLRYRCTVSPDRRDVTEFAFAAGRQIPHREWEDHFLNADDDWLN